jgi:hypothetical protein
MDNHAIEIFHLVVAMASKQREVFDLNTEVKVTEGSGKDKRSV